MPLLLRDRQIPNPPLFFQLMSGDEQFKEITELCKTEHRDRRKRGKVGKDNHHRQEYD